MRAFGELLESICARPAMYVGDGNLFHVALFLNGYVEGLAACGAESPMPSWTKWIEVRFGISDPAWHWTSILVHAFGDERAALSALPSLYTEYRAAVDQDGLDGIERTHATQFADGAKRGPFVPGARPRQSCGFFAAVDSTRVG